MNWGTKLILGMALFMSFILVLVVKMVSSNEDALIENNYYEKGQTYNSEYSAKQRVIKDKVLPEIEVNQYGLTISFTQPAHYKLLCKRPSDATMDKTFEGDTDDDCTLHIPKGKLEKGPWQLQLEYSIYNTTYLVEREILMP